MALTAICADAHDKSLCTSRECGVLTLRSACSVFHVSLSHDFLYEHRLYLPSIYLIFELYISQYFYYFYLFRILLLHDVQKSKGYIIDVHACRIWTILTMMHNTQNYWVSGLCPSSGILNTRKEGLENWICFRPQVMGGRHLLCWVP
jgi:hypothetical protein